MQHVPIGAAHAGGGALLHLHRLAQCLPTVIDLRLILELSANQLHTLIRQHCDEQMTIDTVFLLMKHLLLYD